MNNLERLQLDKMVSANNTEDFTLQIRKLKHSSLIKKDVQAILSIKKQNKYASYNELDKLCVSKCQFLFMYYSNIFTKLVKDEIDVSILNQLIARLEDIEKGNLSQHEASFEVGKLLKKIYIDSALKHAEKLNTEKEQKPTLTPKSISWKQFKQTHLK